MKICGIICEYNPFHDGHAYLLGQAREKSGCDAIVCVLSGNFTQRGEAAVLEKHVRARHAVLAGADAVVELPVPFAISPAEVFARGGIRLLASLPAFSCLAFGCESGDAGAFRAAAELLGRESGPFRAALRAKLQEGYSLTRARFESLLQDGRTEEAALLRSPNNILGIEYCKALRAEGSDAAVLPVPRKGAGYADEALHPRFSSAAAIRAALAEGNTAPLRGNLPDFVLDDLARRPDTRAFRTVAVCAALSLPPEKLRAVLDCTEGLENRLRALARETPDYEDVVRGATGKRYIASRIRRILAAAALGIEGKLVRESLRAALYLNVLAVRKSRADELLPALAGGAFPALLRGGDEQALSPEAARCLEADRRAEDVYAAVTGCPPPLGHRTLFV